MPQIDVNVRKERAKELRIECKKNSSSWKKNQIGSFANVLMESENQGHCEHFSDVKSNVKLSKGSIHKLKITKIDNDYLVGNLQES